MYWDISMPVYSFGDFDIMGIVLEAYEFLGTFCKDQIIFAI